MTKRLDLTGAGAIYSLNTNEFLKLIEKYYTDRIQNDARIQHKFLTLQQLATVCHQIRIFFVIHGKK